MRPFHRVCGSSGLAARTELAGVKSSDLATESDSLRPAQPSRAAPAKSCRLRLVPHALELCDVDLAATSTAQHPTLGGNGAPLPAGTRLGVEANKTGGPRQRPGAGCETGPDSSCFRAIRFA